MYLSIKILDYNTFLYYITLQSALQKDFSSLSSLILFKMSSLGVAHRCWGKRSPFPKICHTYPTIMKLGTVIPYLMKIQKIYESRDAPVEFCCHKHFFTWNQQILLYQEIQIAFWYIVFSSFNFFWMFKDFFNKHGYNFYDVSKNSCFRSS